MHPTKQSRRPRERPSRLYKYRVLGTNEEYTRAILLDHKIWFARPSSFNDPFDCNLYVPYRLSRGELGERLIDRVWPEGDGPKGKEIGAIFNAKARGEEVSRAQMKSAGGALLRQLLADVAGRGVSATFESRDQKIDLNARVNEQRHDRLKKVIDTLDASVGVLSLCEKPDHILMWSHYADNHHGLCLEFDVEKFRDLFPRLQPVRYETMPKISAKFPAMVEKLWKLGATDRKVLILDLASKLAGESLEGTHSEEMEKALESEMRYLLDWFYTKSTAWKYEREWRALAVKSGLVEFPPEALTGVIVGCAASESTLEKVRIWAGERDSELKISVAQKKKGTFGLEIAAAR